MIAHSLSRVRCDILVLLLLLSVMLLLLLLAVSASPFYLFFFIFILHISHTQLSSVWFSFWVAFDRCSFSRCRHIKYDEMPFLFSVSMCISQCYISNMWMWVISLFSFRLIFGFGYKHKHMQRTLIPVRKALINIERASLHCFLLFSISTFTISPCLRLG